MYTHCSPHSPHHRHRVRPADNCAGTLGRALQITGMHMINRYKKTDAPMWRRNLVLLLGFLFGATLLLFAVWAVLLYF